MPSIFMQTFPLLFTNALQSNANALQKNKKTSPRVQPPADGRAVGHLPADPPRSTTRRVQEVHRRFDTTAQPGFLAEHLVIYLIFPLIYIKQNFPARSPPNHPPHATIITSSKAKMTIKIARTSNKLKQRSQARQESQENKRSISNTRQNPNSQQEQSCSPRVKTHTFMTVL